MLKDNPAKLEFKKLLFMAWATICVGIIAGIAGTSLAFLLHYIQHLSYGYSLNAVVSNESFLQGVMHASPWRRFLVLSICAIIAGVGWYCLARYTKKPLISIADALKLNRPLMPFTTIINDLLQIITVALGSPLGREVAPREFAAVLTGWFTQKINLDEEKSRILFACAAGAGLAAVYNVPLGGAFFVMEVLLKDIRWPILIPAFVTSSIAVLVSWLVLGNAPLYQLAQLQLDSSLLIWSIVCGPIFGFGAYGFSKLILSARVKAPKNYSIIFPCIINFLFIGVLAMYFPALLGNGKSPAQLEFLGATSFQVTVILLLLRTFIVWSTLRAGAQGGLLTPSLANGALLGVLLGFIWNACGASIPLAAYAVVGATAFLAAAQKMPLTAIILIFELTHLDMSFLPAVVFAVASTLCFFNLMAKK